MDHIVLDMEWNQALTRKAMVTEPVLLVGEIIQIGAVRLDEDFQVCDRFQMRVAPRYYTVMQDMVSRLTGITTADLAQGSPFPQAVTRFRIWCGRDFDFLIWGREDIDILRSNLALHGLADAWLPPAYNLQPIYNEQVGRTEGPVALAKALRRLDLPALTAHDALNDALATAAVASCLDMAGGLAEYDELEERLRARRAVRDSLNQVCYARPREIFRDPQIMQFFCPICGGKAVCRRAYRHHHNVYIGLAQCQNGSRFFVRFHIKRAAQGCYVVKRHIDELTDARLRQVEEAAGRRRQTRNRKKYRRR